MKTATRERAKILAEMENIPFAVQGKICENRKPLANGGVGVYHNLQWWADGKNHAVHIPEARLEEFKRAVEGGKRIRELVYELSEASTQALLAAELSRAHHFDVSPDTLQDIVEKMRAEATKFTWLSDLGPKEDAKRIMDIVYVLVDGTGLPFRRSSLRGAKGKNGRAKTREAKMGVIFVGGVDSDGRPFRLSDTTTYVATTHRWGKFMKLLRAEFDRRFGQHPRKIVFISDGGKWITSVRNNEFPDSTFILDFFHAAEHLEPVLELMGLKKGTKAWKQKFRYYAKRMRQGKVLSVIASAEKACPNSTKMRKALKYFSDNEKLGRMAYDKFEAEGLFIGSGVVESGCKTVLGARLKQSGMFWSLRGAKGMIPLRTLEKSGRLDEFFNWRLRNLEQVVYTKVA